MTFTAHALVQILITVVFAYAAQVAVKPLIEWLIGRFIGHHKYASKADADKRKHTIAEIFVTASRVIIWLVAVLVTLSELSINVAALATGAGVIGLVVGFGAQDTMNDILAGIYIISENQYRIGDIVSLRVDGAEISGVVEEITVRITRLRDLDGNVHIVTNGSINATANFSFVYANVNVDIGVAYEADIDKVEKVINEVGAAMANDSKWGDHIIEPIQFLRVDGFEDSAVRIKCLGKVAPAMQWDLAGEFRRRIKKAFEAASISIPFNQVVVHNAKK